MGARFARWWVCGDGRTGRRVTSDDLLARPPETKRVDANKKSNATGVGLSLGGGTKGSAVAQRRPAVSWPPAHRSDSEKPARISVESEWQVLAKIRDTSPPPSPRPIGGRRACDRTTVLPPHPMAVTCFFFNIHLVVAVVAFLLRRWLFHAIERRCVGGGRFFSLLVCGPSSQRANRDHKRDLRIEFIHLVKSRPF